MGSSGRRTTQAKAEKLGKVTVLLRTGWQGKSMLSLVWRHQWGLCGLCGWRRKRHELHPQCSRSQTRLVAGSAAWGLGQSIFLSLPGWLQQRRMQRASFWATDNFSGGHCGILRVSRRGAVSAKAPSAPDRGVGGRHEAIPMGTAQNLPMNKLEILLMQTS